MECLRSTLPAKWRRLLNSDTPCELSTDQNNFRIIVPKSNEQVLTIKLTTKKIYDILIENSDDDPIKRYMKWKIVIFLFRSNGSQFGNLLTITSQTTNSVIYTGRCCIGLTH